MSKYQTFLSYNSKDFECTSKLATLLKENSITVWFDEWELRPGMSWQEGMENGINNSSSMVICIGENGFGAWELPEMRAGISEHINRKMPIIPLLLPNCKIEPKLPIFLKGFAWVDFRKGFSDNENLEKLLWGITGEKAAPKLTTNDYKEKLEEILKQINIWKETLDWLKTNKQKLINNAIKGMDGSSGNKKHQDIQMIISKCLLWVEDSLNMGTKIPVSEYINKARLTLEDNIYIGILNEIKALKSSNEKEKILSNYHATILNDNAHFYKEYFDGDFINTDLKIIILNILSQIHKSRRLDNYPSDEIVEIIDYFLKPLIVDKDNIQ